jgi:Cys-tRNA(Pro)/Cys-tRNA(Cys) deacylase
MSKTTRATQELAKAGVVFAVHTYDYDPDAASVGLHAAQSLGLPPGRVFKTLLAQVDGKAVCAVVPSDREVSMKKLAAAFGGKHAEMMKPADAERLSGYVVGGISPFGMKKRVPVAIEELAFEHEKIVMNGGGRGVQVELAPGEALRVLGAKRASLVA